MRHHPIPQLLRLLTAAAFLFEYTGLPVLAKQLPKVTVPPASVKVVDPYQSEALTPGTNLKTGTHRNDMCSSVGAVPGSPGFYAHTSHSSVGDANSPWGARWSSSLDQTVELFPGGALAWTDGTGTKRLFFPDGVNPDGTLRHKAPPDTYTTFSVTANPLGGLPTAVVQKEPDGTTVLYQVFGSTPTLYKPAQLADPNGNTLGFARDAQGRMTGITDVHGRTLGFAYASGRVASATDSFGRTTAFGYDAQGDRTTQSDPNGPLGYGYDGAHRLASLSYGDGGTRNLTYDAQGRVLSEFDNGGANARTYAYFPDRTEVSDSLGRVRTYRSATVGGLSKVSEAVDALGNKTTLAYDANLNLTGVTDPNNRTTSFGYDAQGNVTQVTDPAGGVVLASYDPRWNLPASVKDPLGRTTLLSYDSHGNLTSVQDALNNQARMAYDAQGHMTAMTDPLGRSMALGYDGNGALVTATDPLNRTTTLTRDGASRVTRVVDPKGKQSDFSYDPAGNLLTATDHLGGLTAYGYEDGRGAKRLKSVTDAKGHATGFAYDALGRLQTVTNAVNQANAFAYDSESRLTSVTDGNGRTTSFGYDAADRLTSKTVPLTPADPGGAVSYGYDAAGNLTSASHYNGSGVQLTYDSLDRVTQVIQALPGGFTATLGYSYDANGNRTGMTTPWGSFSYGYDQLDRLTSIVNPQGQTVAFAYDALGRRTSMVYPNGVGTAYAYDAAGQLGRIEHKKTGAANPLAFTAYVYDPAGNRTSLSDAEGSHSFAYDDLHRLTSAGHPAASVLPVKNEAFAYDAVGNRTSDALRSGYAYDNANRLLSDSQASFTSDADGNVTGRTLAGQTLSFGYDADGRMVEARGAAGVVGSYKYGVGGDRIEKVAGGVTQRFVYDGRRVLAILDGSNNLTALFTNGPGIDSPLVMRRGAQDTFYHADALGNITALTDGQGNAVETVAYQAYGRAAVRDAVGGLHAQSTVGSPFLYASREFDAETGLYFMRARYYDAEIGRFYSEDPLPSINPFAYVNGNPVSLTDPLGLSGKDDAINSGAGFINGVVSTFSFGKLEFRDAGFGHCSAEYATGNTIGRITAWLIIGEAAGAAAGKVISRALARSASKIETGASSAASGAKLNAHLGQLEEYGEAGYRILQGGRIRYYGEISPARKAGTMVGRRVVREWDPVTGAARNWMETLDAAGRTRIVRPVADGAKTHYLFDEFGNYIGSF